MRSVQGRQGYQGAWSIQSNAMVSYEIYVVTQIVEKRDGFTGSGTKDLANYQSKQPRIAKEILNGV